MIGSMGDYEQFQQLALRPHTKTSLALMTAATRVANKRFETCTSTLHSATSTSFPPPEVAVQEDIDECLQDLVGPVNDIWTECVRKLSQLQLQHPSEGSRISQSMWDLVHGGPLDIKIVESYLQLLRHTSRRVVILRARMLREGRNSIQETEGIAHPVIIPFLHESHWAFAVAYPDCVHWYDSMSDLSGAPLHGDARPIIEGWQSPRSGNAADSGVFMLMGIKLILQRKPHLSQGVAQTLVQPFRASTFLELLCRKPKPSSEDLLNMNLDQVIATGDICTTTNQLNQNTAVAYGQEQQLPVEDELFVTERADHADDPPFGAFNPTRETIHPESTTTIPPVTDPGLAPESVTAHRQPAANTSRTRRSRPAFVDGKLDTYICNSTDDLKVILDNLSHGLQFKRSALASSNDNPLVLERLLRYPRTSGNLHRRYHAVLLHNIVKEDARQMQREPSLRNKSKKSLTNYLRSWSLWKKISDVGVTHGLGPYVTLCAFQNDFSGYRIAETKQKPFIRELEKRLQDKSDMLRVRLQMASKLCEAILCGPTPVSLFNIDDYDFQAESEVTDEKFEFYTHS